MINKFSCITSLLVALGSCGTGADAAQVYLNFKDSVMVSDTAITLGDIASIRTDNAAQQADLANLVVGDAAPAGYSRFIGRDDLITYKLQSMLKSVELSATGAKRTCVTTSYKEVSVSEIDSLFEVYLRAELAWPEGSWTLNVLNSDETFKVLDKPFRTEFSGLLSNRPRGQFSVQMAVMQGSKTVRVSLLCALQVTAPVVMTLKPIQRGDIVNASDCEIRTVDITRYGIIPCDSLSQVMGKKALRQIGSGQVLTRQWIQQIPAIEKGDPVKLESKQNLVRVAVDAVARESGSIGEKIWVENSVSHKMIRVMVKAKGKVSTL